MNPSVSPGEEPRIPRDAWIVLGVLFLVSILNFVDRQILSILIRDIKGSLQVTDAQMGFLWGTVFAAFYTVFGIPLGLYADLGSRKKLIAWGLTLWSFMTMMSGFANTFPALALARMGVGIGEASASPAAYSLIADLFPKTRRATAIGIYSLGVYIGIGLSSYVGGQVVDRWNHGFPLGQTPLGLVGWQAAFVAAGLPGLLLVPFVFLLREPARLTGAAHTGASAVRRCIREGLALLPPTSFLLLHQDGIPVGPNVFAFGALVAVTAGLTLAFADPIQWACLASGLYVVATLAQRLKANEPDTHVLIFRTPSLMWATLGFSCLSITGYGMGFSVAEFFIRYHGYTPARIGGIWGFINAVCGGLGVLTGGYLADRFRARAASGRLWVGMMNALLPLPFLISGLLVGDPRVAILCFAGALFFSAMWLPAGSSTVQDLVLPHMRARASAVFLLFINLISLALGPYLVGRLSDHWGSLRYALMAASAANLVAFVLFVVASRSVARDEETREDRARAAGARA
ncbi:MAG: MFS transporter [Vicinamibacteria bacterium]